MKNHFNTSEFVNSNPTPDMLIPKETKYCAVQHSISNDNNSEETREDEKESANQINYICLGHTENDFKAIPDNIATTVQEDTRLNAHKKEKLKRSLRGRKCKSTVLQNAIARKVQLYNEPSSSQEFVKQCKPAKRKRMSKTSILLRQSETEINESNGSKSLKKKIKRNKRYKGRKLRPHKNCSSFTRSNLQEEQKVNFDTDIDHTYISIGTTSICLCTENKKLYRSLDNDDMSSEIFHELKQESCEESFTEGELIDAVSKSDVKKMSMIIASGKVNINIELPECNNSHILHFAASNGLEQVIQLLLIAKVDVDVLDKEQNTPLMLAVNQNRTEVVDCLLRAGANATLKATDGMNALHLAAKHGNLEICKLLLNVSPKNYINSQDDGGWTPLIWAAGHGHAQVAHFLVDQGAEPFVRDAEKNTALHWASFSGCSDVVHLLLAMGCEVNAANCHGDTALHVASRENRYRCVFAFLTRGANIFIKNKNGESAVDCALNNSDVERLIQLNMKLQAAMGCRSLQKQKVLTNDISRGREPIQIKCINDVDNELEPRDFVYITSNCVTSDKINIDVKLSNIHSCKCENQCLEEQCECGKISTNCWYDADGRLKLSFNFNDSPLIFECNDICSCNAAICRNRVVQKGYSQNFQVFRTPAKGWGVQTLKAIPKGSYVCEYIGELLTDSDGELREDDSYLFDLDNRESDSYCIDAKFYGNFARFINHSCDPNLHPVKVFIEHQDLRFPRIALFARTDINLGEELSFDYGDKFWLVKYKSFTCECGTKACKYSVETIQDTLQKHKLIET